MKIKVALFVFILAFVLVCSTANTASGDASALGECVEFIGRINAITGDCVVLENRRGIFFLKYIANVATYELPLLMAAERGQPIYIQLRSTRNGAKIIFLRFIPLSPKLSKAEE